MTKRPYKRDYSTSEYIKTPVKLVAAIVISTMIAIKRRSLTLVFSKLHPPCHPLRIRPNEARIDAPSMALGENSQLFQNLHL
jgi:hypothetical protein